MLYLYSATIQAFIQRLTQEFKMIMRTEMGLQIYGQRFYNNDISYPINIVCFEDPKKLGYFDPDLYELGINKLFAFPQHAQQLPNLLRHELAHYMAFIIHGSPGLGHDAQYHTICQGYGWGKEVYAAVTELEDDISTGSFPKESRILEKVKKLLSLATSSNSHEAEQATLKSNALLLKYNLESVTNPDLDEEYVIKRVLESKRNNSKLRALTAILRTFLVRPVVNGATGKVYLEVFGTRANVLTADYLASYLDRELELLWKATQKLHPHLKGISSKNSFFRGLAEGYCQKIEQQTQTYKGNEQRALVVLEKQLDVKMEFAYPSLRSIRTQYQHCSQSTELGFEEGKNLNIRKPLSGDSTTQKKRYLTLK